MGFEPYALYWADVPFEDQPDSKVRPIIIIEDKICLVNLLPITSNTSRSEDYCLKYWKEAGLRRASAVQVQYVVEIEPERIGEKIGKLHPVDILEIKQRLG